MQISLTSYPRQYLREIPMNSDNLIPDLNVSRSEIHAKGGYLRRHARHSSTDFLTNAKATFSHKIFSIDRSLSFFTSDILFSDNNVWQKENSVRPLESNRTCFSLFVYTLVRNNLIFRRFSHWKNFGCLGILKEGGAKNHHASSNILSLTAL